MKRTCLLVILLLAPRPAGDRLTFDRKALDDFLAKKNLKAADIAFDFDHLNSMPEVNFARASAPNKDFGHLKLFRRIQKAPLTFPDEVQEISERILRGEIFEAACAAIDRDFERKAAEPVSLELPEDLRKPVGRIVGALQSGDAAAIFAAILEAKPALHAFKGDVDYAKDGIVVTNSRKPEDPDVRLWIKFGGDDLYKGRWAGADGGHPMRVVIDVGGNDTYDAGSENAAQGAGHNGVGILADLDGNDTYTTKGEIAQGAGYEGTGILYDAAGDDRYVAQSFGQGAAENGLGFLIDDAGRDSYEITSLGQAYALTAGFGLLLDRDGDDSYLGRDPMHGQPVTIPAPQDEKHNANMVQGAASGRNSPPFKAGGVALLLDVRGDDLYRSGCWSQGVGYFLGVGALLDLGGDDEYQSWVYVMGSGAHGGQGMLLDRRGNDLYRVGGWNSLAMSVDYGIGHFLDGAGNDQYLGSASGHGMSIGIGISVFQDSGGDDVYQPKDGNLGMGRFYEQEDYNSDGKITQAEKRHWGLFLDLGGSDRYPAAFGNARRWDPADVAGGIDAASAKPDFNPGKARLWDGKSVDVTDANWEDVRADDLFKLLKGDERQRAIFAFEHGLIHEASEWLSKVPDPKPLLERYLGTGEFRYEPALRLWVLKSDDVWIDKLKALAWPADISAWKPDPAWPKWAQREAMALARSEISRRASVHLERVQKWLDRKESKALLAKKKEIDALRDAAHKAVATDDVKAADDAVKRLSAAWSGRRTPSVKNDIAEAARELDLLDPGWRGRVALEGMNLTEPSLTPEALASWPLPNLSKLSGPAKSILQTVNDYRVMLGRAPLEPDETLGKHAAKSTGGKAEAAPDGFEIVPLTGRAKSASELLEAWRKIPAEHRTLLDSRWTVAGAAATGNGAWCFTLGQRKK